MPTHHVHEESAVFSAPPTSASAFVSRLSLRTTFDLHARARVKGALPMFLNQDESSAVFCHHASRPSYRKETVSRVPHAAVRSPIGEERRGNLK